MRIGLIGHPLGHSVSPPLQEAAFAAAGEALRYELLDVIPLDLPSLLAGMRTAGWLGCNVTVPYKTTVPALLDELRDDAAVLHAVNTVRVVGERLVGYNTDVGGFAADLGMYLNLRDEPGAAVVLGAGGSARAVVWALVAAGWEVAVLARRPALAEALRHSLPGGGVVRAGALDATTARARVARARLLVNCTPAGMWPHGDVDPLPPEVTLLPGLFVYDLVYRPRETRLLRRAAAAGCRTAGGLGMLVAQGALSYTLWTGRPAPVEVMRAAAERALATWDASPPDGSGESPADA